MTTFLVPGDATAPPGGLVLDPLCGSGTTLVAAQERQRHGLGVDINADYLAEARRRLDDTPARLL